MFEVDTVLVRNGTTDERTVTHKISRKCCHGKDAGFVFRLDGEEQLLTKPYLAMNYTKKV